VAGGGWSSPDEATVSFDDMLDNFMQGHSFLLKEFGTTPKVGWNLDGKGHSAAAARIYSQLGFDAQFFANVDHDLKQKLLKQKEMNFLWRPFEKQSGAEFQLLTGVLKDKGCWAANSMSE